MHTIDGHWPGLPVELGAEFVHGAKNELWTLIRAADLETDEVPDRHLVFSEGVLRENTQFYGEIEEVFSKAKSEKEDLSFCALLIKHESLTANAKTLALEYVEGFHAADPNRVSVQSLVRAEKASDKDQGTRQFRLRAGYGRLLEWLGKFLEQRGVRIQLGTVVESVEWEKGRVQVTARSPEGPQKFEARQALITLPIGVLQERGPSGVRFVPELKSKQAATEGLTMGHVLKVTLEFRSAFWPVPNFGFIHAIGARFPTWWSDQRGPCLTAWAGGPRASQMESAAPEEIQDEALTALSRIFKIGLPEMREQFVAMHHHDWTRDPFVRGAYSYTPVGMNKMAQELAEPMDHTLFFAGEATDSQGEQGTVHAAMASGHRAAKQMLADSRC